MDFFWVAYAGIRSQPKQKSKQLHLLENKHTHTQLCFSIWLPVGQDAYWSNPTSQSKATQAVQLHYVQLNDFHSILLSAAPHTHTLAHQNTQMKTYVTLSFACQSGKRKKVLATESIIKTSNTSDQVAYREQQTENRNRPKRHFSTCFALIWQPAGFVIGPQNFCKPSRTLCLQPCFTMPLRAEGFVLRTQKDAWMMCSKKIVELNVLKTCRNC